MTAEGDRVAGFGKLEDGLRQSSPWYAWGPYVSERQWGTVREDYSQDGDAWNYLPFDHARSRAYRWGEDGLAGFSDIHQQLCLGLALWNGRDAFLKERLFGLTGPEGNHGEDVKEHWWYLDALPSHAWNRWRYHYPQATFPYERLRLENSRRDRRSPEYEILDTGVFDQDRYWITEVAYAKSDDAHELLIEITATNVGEDAETLHVLPTAWFRNTWSWENGAPKPVMKLGRQRRRRHRAPLPRRSRAARGHRRRRRVRQQRHPDAAVLRERDQRAAALRLPAGDALPQGRHQRPRGRRCADREPGAAGHQVRLLVPADGPARRDRAPAAAAAGRSGRREPTVRSIRRILILSCSGGGPRRTSSTRR